MNAFYSIIDCTNNYHHLDEWRECDDDHHGLRFFRDLDRSDHGILSLLMIFLFDGIIIRISNY